RATGSEGEEGVAQRVTALLEARLRERDRLHAERSLRFVPLARSLAENEEESAIIGMLLDDYYQQTLHGPLVQPSGTPLAGEPSRQRPAHSRRRRRAAETGRRGGGGR